MRTFKQIYEDCYALMQRKQKQYVREANPHQAFHEAAFAAGVTPVQHDLGKLNDKSQRVRNMHVAGSKDYDGPDGMISHAEDIVNYGIFLVRLLEEERDRELPVKAARSKDPFKPSAMEAVVPNTVPIPPLEIVRGSKATLN